jgi:hypothetical protein
MTSTADRIKDIGPQPQSFDIERATKENTDYRSVAWSGRYLQVTLMSIPAGRLQMGPAKDTWHNITNTGATPMQVYAIYAPAHHTPDKVQATEATAEADKDDKPAAWSVQLQHTPDKHG